MLINLINIVILRVLLATLAIICLDAILGVWLAWTKDELDISKLPQFLKTNVLPYVGALTLIALWSLWLPEIEALFYVFAAAANIKFLKEIKDKMLELLPNANVPAE